MHPIRQALIPLFLALAVTSTAAAQDSIPWVQDLSQARSLAEQQQRLVLLHFWSDNCAPCQNLEANVFNQPELIRVISTGFIPVKVHVQQQSKIASFYKIDRYPTDVIVLPNGREIFRTVSPGKANSYIAMLDQVRANALANGLQEIHRATDGAERFAQNVSQQVAPYLPSLPARGDEEATSQSVANDLGVGSINNFANSGRAALESRGAIVNNSFVGPLDRKTESKSAGGTGPRYDNPYVDNQTPAQPAPQVANTAPPVAQPAPQVAQPAPQVAQPFPQVAQPAPQVAQPAQQVLQTAPQFPAPQVSQPAPPVAQQALSGNRWTGSDGTLPPQGASRPWDAGQTAQAGLTNPVAQVQQSPAVPQRQPWETAGVIQGAVAPGTNPQGVPAGQFGGSPVSGFDASPVNQVPQPSAPLSPNLPPLALDGYCPVSLMEGQKWERGNPQFGAIHRGRTYLFRSGVERDRFLSSPGAADHYAPVLSGYDPVRFAELHQTVEGSRAYGVVYQDQIYLFADEQAMVQFEREPRKYVSVVQQAMLNARNGSPQR